MFNVILHVVLQQIAAIVLPRILQRDIRLVPGSECKCERLHAVLKHIDVLLLPGIVCYCVVLHASISMSSFSHGPPNTSWLRPTLRSPDKTPPENFLYFVLLNLWETMTL